MNARLYEYSGCVYRILDSNSACLQKFSMPCETFIVPDQIVLPDQQKYNVISVHRYAFNFWSKLDKVVFQPNSHVKELHSHLFVMTGVKNIILPPKVQIICDTALSDVLWDNIEIDESNKYFKKLSNVLHHIYPFEVVRSERNVKRCLLRNGITRCFPAAYICSNNIRYVHIPASCRIIGYSAFKICSNLTRVTFDKDSKLEEIHTFAFSQCPIKKIHFPKSIREIGDSAFELDEELSVIKFHPQTKMKSISRSAFSYTKISQITIPSSVETIDELAFFKCSHLVKLTFPKDSRLKLIGQSAFSENSLKSIIFPETLEKIGVKAFYSCQDLEFVNFQPVSHNCLIEDGAFSKCRLDQLY